MKIRPNFHYFFCRHTGRFISSGTYTCWIIGYLTQIRKERWISLCIIPLPQSILVWKSMYVTKLFGNVFKNYSYFTLFKWNWNWRGSFFKNPPDGAEHSLKCIESRNWRHFHFKHCLRPSTLLLCEKKIFFSEKAWKMGLCHFSLEIYVIKFFPGHVQLCSQ